MGFELYIDDWFSCELQYIWQCYKHHCRGYLIRLLSSIRALKLPHISLVFQGNTGLFSRILFSAWYCWVRVKQLLLSIWLKLDDLELLPYLCEKGCQWLAAGRLFSPDSSVSPNNKTDRYDITEILLKVTLNTIKPNTC